MSQSPESEVYEVHLTVPANNDFAGAIRDFTLQALKNVVQADDVWAYRIQLVVDELFMNAVRYGSSKQSKVYLHYLLSSTTVAIEVEDEGQGHQKLDAAELRSKIGYAQEQVRDRALKCVPNLATSGRGLAQIATEWSDCLEFENREAGGIRVRVHKHF